MVLRMLIPMSGMCFIDKPTQYTINSGQKLPEHFSYYSVIVQEMVSSCCFFPYLELHLYSHWSYRTIWPIVSSCLVINFIWVSATHLVIQETIIMKNQQNTNDRASNINKFISEYLRTSVRYGPYLPRSPDKSVLHESLSLREMMSWHCT